MSYWINPDLYCLECWKRPKTSGRAYCTPCIRLARAVGRRMDDEPEEDPAARLIRTEGRCRSHLEGCAVDPRSRAYELMQAD